MKRLETWLRGQSPVAVAVSGGVDSLTLATLAGRVLGGQATMFHARSVAVPADATQRVADLGAAEGWRLKFVEADEFSDPDYRRNPVDRCFYCKNRLFTAIRRHTESLIVTGNNVDDLGDYRPGLRAAEHHAVRHPYIEVGIGKEELRHIARWLGLGPIAELPAGPCLSSRIETGIRVEPALLALVQEAERLIAQAVAARTIRCRVRAAGLVVELDPEGLAALGARQGQLALALGALFADAGQALPVSFAPYQTGSAFVGAR